MFFKIAVTIFCVGLLTFGVLLPNAFSEEVEVKDTAVQSDIQTLKNLVEASSIILIAKVEIPRTSSEKIEKSKPADNQIDLQKELDRAREETSRTFSGLNVGKLIHLNTVETLKGPQTQSLSLPMTDPDLKNAITGDLFLIMMGSNHPDAIRKISSVEDSWVERVKKALSPTNSIGK